MTKADALSQVINRASLLMPSQEDWHKAIRAAEVHPALAEMLMRMHHTLTQLDKDVATMRNTMLTIVRVVDTAAGAVQYNQLSVSAIMEKMGVTMDDLMKAGGKTDEG